MIAPGIGAGPDHSLRAFRLAIQGRGEFIWLALEEPGADYVDMARESGRRVHAMMVLRDDLAQPPLAPLFLRVGRLGDQQTAKILQYLGQHVRLVPKAGPRGCGRISCSSRSRTWWPPSMIHITPAPPHSIIVSRNLRPSGAAITSSRNERQHFSATWGTPWPSGGAAWLDAARGMSTSMFQFVARRRYAFPRMMSRLEPLIPIWLSCATGSRSEPNPPPTLPRRSGLDVWPFCHFGPSHLSL